MTCPCALNSVKFGNPPQPTIQLPPGSACVFPWLAVLSGPGERTSWVTSVAVFALGSSLTISPRDAGLTGGGPPSSHRLILRPFSPTALCWAAHAPPGAMAPPAPPADDRSARTGL